MAAGDFAHGHGEAMDEGLPSAHSVDCAQEQCGQTQVQLVSHRTRRKIVMFLAVAACGAVLILGVQDASRPGASFMGSFSQELDSSMGSSSASSSPVILEQESSALETALSRLKANKGKKYCNHACEVRKKKVKAAIARKMKQLRDQINSDFSSMIDFGHKAGYLPPPKSIKEQVMSGTLLKGDGKTGPDAVAPPPFKVNLKISDKDDASSDSDRADASDSDSSDDSDRHSRGSRSHRGGGDDRRRGHSGSRRDSDDGDDSRSKGDSRRGDSDSDSRRRRHSASRGSDDDSSGRASRRHRSARSSSDSGSADSSDDSDDSSGGSGSSDDRGSDDGSSSDDSSSTRLAAQSSDDSSSDSSSSSDDSASASDSSSDDSSSSDATSSDDSSDSSDSGTASSAAATGDAWAKAFSFMKHTDNPIDGGTGSSSSGHSSSSAHAKGGFVGVTTFKHVAKEDKFLENFEHPSQASSSSSSSSPSSSSSGGGGGGGGKGKDLLKSAETDKFLAGFLGGD